MLIASVTLFLALSGPIPCDGPAEPLPFLSKCSLAEKRISNVWSQGVYSPITFIYRSSLTPKELKATFIKEAGSTLSGEESKEDKDAYTGVRQFPGLMQQWRISFRKEGGATFLALYEFQKPGTSPKRWFRDAISPNPPNPMVEFPFFGGIKADSVSTGSLQQLLSEKTTRSFEKDVFIYTVTVPRGGMKASAEKWLLAHGYSKTRSESYFNPASRLFEVYVNEWKVKGASMSGVTAYYTEKKVDRPIVWDRF